MNFSLVVGGSKGIGLEIANLFAQRGDEVFVLSRSRAGWGGKHIKADLSSFDSLEAAIDLIQTENIQFKYLIFAQKNRISPTDMDLEFMVQLKSTKFLVERITANMSGGAIVLLGSPAGRFIVREQPVSYHLCKAAMEQLTRYYAVHLGKQNITVNCIMPGTILKEYNREFYNANANITNILKKISPLGILGEAKDVANAVEFFCSNKSLFITGQSICIDGGQSLEGQESLAKELISSER